MNMKQQQQQRLFLAAVVVALVLALAGGLAVGAAPQDMLRLICENKDAKLAKINELRAIILLIKSGGSDDTVACRDDIKQAILDLEPLIEARSVCTPDSADLIGHYQLKYVNRNIWEPRSFLPKSLRDFFLAYGFVVSKVCKQTLISMLELADSEWITDEDNQIVVGWTASPEKGNIMKDFTSDEMNLEDLFIVQDFRHMYESDGEPSEERAETETLAVKPRTKFMLDEMKSRCLNKFKPIYDQLMVPIVKLSYLGLNFKEDSIEQLMSELKASELYRRWYRAVFVCESMIMMRTVVVPERELPAGSEQVEMFVLSEEEIEQVKADFKLTSVHEQQQPGGAEEVEGPVRAYDEPIRVDPEESLLVQSDPDLRGLVGRYNAAANKSFRIHTMMLTKLGSLLKVYMSSGNIRYGLKQMSKDSAEQITEALDNYKKADGEKRKRLIEHTKTYKFLKWAIWAGAVSTAVGILITLASVTALGSYLSAVSLCFGTLLAFLFAHTREAVARADRLRDERLAAEAKQLS